MITRDVPVTVDIQQEQMTAAFSARLSPEYRIGCYDMLGSRSFDLPVSVDFRRSS